MQKLIAACQILALVFAASVAAMVLSIGVAGAVGVRPWSEGGQLSSVPPPWSVFTR